MTFEPPSKSGGRAWFKTDSVCERDIVESINDGHSVGLKSVLSS